MSNDHIKIGKVIRDEINEEIVYQRRLQYHDTCVLDKNRQNAEPQVEQLEQETYVLLSWLKEPFYSQLEWHLDEILKGNQIDLNVGSIKRMFSYLLEEKKL